MVQPISQAFTDAHASLNSRLGRVATAGAPGPDGGREPRRLSVNIRCDCQETFGREDARQGAFNEQRLANFFFTCSNN